MNKQWADSVILGGPLICIHLHVCTCILWRVFRAKNRYNTRMHHTSNLHTDRTAHPKRFIDRIVSSIELSRIRPSIECNHRSNYLIDRIRPSQPPIECAHRLNYLIGRIVYDDRSNATIDRIISSIEYDRMQPSIELSHRTAGGIIIDCRVTLAL